MISSGGVSAGEEDHILDALHAEAAELDVFKVAIRPGKPLTVGRLGAALCVGLPGNLCAAAITFTRIARPALCRAAGLREAPDTWLPAVSGFTYRRTDGRPEYIPVTWTRRDALGRPVLEWLGRGASAALRPMAQAMGIAAIPAEVTVVHPGQPLPVDPLCGRHGGDPLGGVRVKLRVTLNQLAHDFGRALLQNSFRKGFMSRIHAVRRVT